MGFDDYGATDVKFMIKKLYVLDLQLRKRRDKDGEEHEYAVIKAGSSNLLKAFLTNPTAAKRAVTLMCFEPAIYYNIEPEQWYSYKGFVSFGYGNTYLCIRSAFNSLGLPVGDPEAECLQVSSCREDPEIGVKYYETSQ